MSRVAPEEENRNACYGKEFKKEALAGTGFTAWPEEYVKKRDALGAKYSTLPDGRKICYWTEGDPTDVPIIALHGGCEGKYKWMQKEPILGVYLIAIDRPNYGGSSPVPLDYTFKDATKDVVDFADSLGLGQFILMGHSVGTSWSQQTAAAYPNRVRGIILFASMADPRHPEADEQVRLAFGYHPLAGYCCCCGKMDCCCHPRTGICGCLPRNIMSSLTGLTGKDILATEVKFKNKVTGGTGEEYCKKFQADPFWVASMVDSWGAHHDGKAILGDTYRSLTGKWHYETKDIKCPVYLFAAEADHDCQEPVASEYLKKLIPHIKVEVVTGAGHVFLNGPNEWTVSRIVEAVKNILELDLAAGPLEVQDLSPQAESAPKQEDMEQS